MPRSQAHRRGPRHGAEQWRRRRRRRAALSTAMAALLVSLGLIPASSSSPSPSPSPASPSPSRERRRRRRVRGRPYAVVEDDWTAVEESSSSSSSEDRPFYADFPAGTCHATAPAASQLTSYPTLKQCCGKNFRHDMRGCLHLGEAAVLLETLPPFLPEWSTHSCGRPEASRPQWEAGYATLEECCEAHFDWKRDECLGIVADHASSTASSTASSIASWGGLVDRDAETWWHPLWPEGHCVTARDQAPAAYMLQDPAAHMFPTYRECCRQFDDGADACLDVSEALASPTRPPASHARGAAPGGPDLAAYYWPAYAAVPGRCRRDAAAAPAYMLRDPAAYLFPTPRECCREHFPREAKACVRAAGGAEGDDAGPAPAPSALHRYDYYPRFGDAACVRTPDAAPPAYAREDPAAFFFVTYEDCCSASYGLEYLECLDNSRRADLGQAPGGEGARPPGPRVAVEFGGRLYFRNVFIPSGTPANMRIVREAILHAVTVALEGYPVASLEGLNFDGIDLVGLDAAVLMGLRGRRRLVASGEGTAPAPGPAPPRRLSRMQLFRFSLSVSLPCADPCADPAATGRAASFAVAARLADAVEDGTLFARLRRDLGSMGLVGPFFAATLPAGYLTYVGAGRDAASTGAPTPAPWARPYYPDLAAGTCASDGRQSEFQTNLYASLDECCKFPWLDEATCLSSAGAFAETAPPTGMLAFSGSSSSSSSSGGSGDNPIDCSSADREQCEARPSQCTWHKKRKCEQCTDCMVPNTVPWNGGGHGGGHGGSHGSGDNPIDCSSADREQCEARPSLCTWHKKRKCEPCTDCMVPNTVPWNDGGHGGGDAPIDCSSADREQCEARPSQCAWHKKRKCEPCTDCMVPNAVPWIDGGHGGGDAPIDCSSADREQCETRPSQCTWHKKRKCEPCTDCMVPNTVPWNGGGHDGGDAPIDCSSADHDQCEAHPSQCTWHKKRKCEPCTDCMVPNSALGGPSIQGISAPPPSPAGSQPTSGGAKVPTGARPYYPDYATNTCMRDGKQPEFEMNLFDSLDECCKFPWLVEATCLSSAGVSAKTTHPIRKPTPHPAQTHWPTASIPTDRPTPPPTPRPTPKPTKKPTTEPVSVYLDYLSAWPTFSPTTPPSQDPTVDPTNAPTQSHTPLPTMAPSVDPTNAPTQSPTSLPTMAPSATMFLSAEATVGEGCSEHGWHIDTRNNGGCTNDNNIPQSWLHLKDRFFKPTADSCCKHFFPDSSKLCFTVDVCEPDSVPTARPTPPPTARPTPPPTARPTPPRIDGPAPRPAAGCSEHGWHFDLTSNAGCTNDDNVTPDWSNPSMINLMFFPTPEDCCDQLFKNRECKIDDAGCADSAPASVSATDLPEGFEGGDLGATKFSTRGLPWTYDDENVFNGVVAIKSSVPSKSQSSELVLNMDFQSKGVLMYELFRDVYMPWANLEVRVDGNTYVRYSGHQGEAKWETQRIDVTEGTHEIVWDVNTLPVQSPPGLRGTSTVWVDDVRFIGTAVFDWGGDTFDDDFTFSGAGKWGIYGSVPGPKDALTVRSQKGLLPGEHSTMEIERTVPGGALFSFEAYLGMGKISFFIDSTLHFTEDKPGQGNQKVEAILTPGTHSLRWRYEPPAHANMPMSMAKIKLG